MYLICAITILFYAHWLLTLEMFQIMYVFLYNQVLILRDEGPGFYDV